MAPGRVAEVVDLWLRSEQPHQQANRDAASLGLELMSWIVEADGGRVVEEALEKTVWRASLAAGAVHPRQVSATVRAALARADREAEREAW